MTRSDVPRFPHGRAAVAVMLVALAAACTATASRASVRRSGGFHLLKGPHNRYIRLSPNGVSVGRIYPNDAVFVSAEDGSPCCRIGYVWAYIVGHDYQGCGFVGVKFLRPSKQYAASNVPLPHSYIASKAARERLARRKCGPWPDFTKRKEVYLALASQEGGLRGAKAFCLNHRAVTLPDSAERRVLFENFTGSGPSLTSRNRAYARYLDNRAGGSDSAELRGPYGQTVPYGYRQGGETQNILFTVRYITRRKAVVGSRLAYVAQVHAQSDRDTKRRWYFVTLTDAEASELLPRLDANLASDDESCLKSRDHCHNQCNLHEGASSATSVASLAGGYCAADADCTGDDACGEWDNMCHACNTDECDDEPTCDAVPSPDDPDCGEGCEASEPDCDSDERQPPCESPGAPWACHAITCDSATVFSGYSPMQQDLQHPVGAVRKGEVLPVHDMAGEDYALRIKFRGSEYYILRQCVDVPRSTCSSPGAPWECHPITCNDAHVFTGYSPFNQDLQNPVGIVRRNQSYPVRTLANESYTARIILHGQEYYIQRACTGLAAPPCTSPGAPWQCRTVSCLDARVFTGYSPSRHDLQNPVGTIHRGESYPVHEMADENYAARIKYRGTELYVLKSCVYAPPPTPTPVATPCGGTIDGWLCRMIDCRDATVFSGYSPARHDLQNPIGTVRAGEWYQSAIVDETAARIRWNGREGYILRYCLYGSCCPNPVAPTPTPMPPPTVPPPLCYAHCCDGRAAETPLASEDQCRHWADAFCGNIKINTIHFPKYNVIYNADSCRCCARCRNREQAYNVGPQIGCTERAAGWCAQSGRGGLSNAYWGSCPDPPH